MGGGSLASVTTPSVVADTLIQDQCSLDFGDGLLGGEGQLGSHAGEEGQLGSHEVSGEGSRAVARVLKLEERGPMTDEVETRRDG